MIWTTSTPCPNVTTSLGRTNQKEIHHTKLQLCSDFSHSSIRLLTTTPRRSHLSVKRHMLLAQNSSSTISTPLSTFTAARVIKRALSRSTTMSTSHQQDVSSWPSMSLRASSPYYKHALCVYIYKSLAGVSLWTYPPPRRRIPAHNFLIQITMSLAWQQNSQLNYPYRYMYIYKRAPHERARAL